LNQKLQKSECKTNFLCKSYHQRHFFWFWSNANLNLYKNEKFFFCIICLRKNFFFNPIRFERRGKSFLKVCTKILVANTIFSVCLRFSSFQTNFRPDLQFKGRLYKTSVDLTNIKLALQIFSYSYKKKAVFTSFQSRPYKKSGEPISFIQDFFEFDFFVAFSNISIRHQKIFNISFRLFTPILIT